MKSIGLKTLLFIVLGFLTINANQTFAQKGKPCPGMGEGKGLNCQIPDLTEAQIKKIDELKIVHQKNMLNINNQLEEKNARLQTLRTADKADMNAINKTIDEIGALKIQMMKERENHLQQVRAQLTENQRLQFDMKHGKCHHGKVTMYPAEAMDKDVWV